MGRGIIRIIGALSCFLIVVIVGLINKKPSKNRSWEKNKLFSSESISADLAYWIADIKLNENAAAIVELGDGNFSGYKVLDNTRFKGCVWSKV